MELEKILEKLDRIKEGDENAEKTDEQIAKEIEETGKKQQEDADLSTESQNNDSKNQDSGNGQNSGNAQGQNNNSNNLPEFFKDFEGKAQVSPDDIKAILSDPTKGQQLIDWAKTQNKIVKEVPGLQNIMKQAQSQPKNNETEGGTDKSTTTDGGNKQQLRPFQDYLEPLGKIMKTQADCDQAIQFFTNLKNTKPAQDNTQTVENNSGGTKTVQNNMQNS